MAGIGADRVMLVVFAGLPGSGKTALARRVADDLGATFLRIDTIETAISVHLMPFRDNPVGYLVASEVAADQLRSDRSVVVDAVNNIDLARAGWRTLGDSYGLEPRFIHVVCSDQTEHRRRVESRAPDLPGQSVPTWSDVRARDWEPWTDEVLVVDNLGAPEPHVSRILDWLR